MILSELSGCEREEREGERRGEERRVGGEVGGKWNTSDAVSPPREGDSSAGDRSAIRSQTIQIMDHSGCLFSDLERIRLAC